jgi:hypothetical protein
VTQRIEPVGPRREIAPADRVPLLSPVERELERERREQRRKARTRKPSEPRQSADSGGSLDVRA